MANTVTALIMMSVAAIVAVSMGLHVPSASSGCKVSVNCAFATAITSGEDVVDSKTRSVFRLSDNVTAFCDTNVGDAETTACPTPFVYAIRQLDPLALNNLNDVAMLDVVSAWKQTPSGPIPWAIVSVEPTAVDEFDTLTLDFKKQLLRLSTKAAVSSTPFTVSNGAQRVGVASKADVVNSLDLAAYETSLRELSGDKEASIDGKLHSILTRYTGTADNELATELLIQECVKLGYDVSTQEYPVRTSVGKNVVCIKRGEPLGDTVVVGGHYDSTSQTPTTLAPGAIDNGSGAMGVLAMAKACSKFSFRSDIIFVFFGGEEQGLYGSNYFVDEAIKNGDSFKAALIFDMIAYSNRYYGVTLECDSSAGCRELMNLAQPNFVSFARDLAVETTTVSFGSDHVPFQRAGVPCFLSIELDDTDYPHYHRNTDTVAHANYNQAMDIVKGVTGTLVDLADLSTLETKSVV
eukprot:m.23160 g.23160  ORF g.23160 m.23160 type:complete len:464 (-) comp14086_c0_seq1:211-1602(-)